MNYHKTILALIAVPFLLLASCAGLQFNANQVRPAATVATVAYLQDLDQAKRPEALARLRATAAKLQLAALTDNPTKAAALAALEELEIDPAGRALAVALVNSLEVKDDAPEVPYLRVSMVNASEGILDAVSSYERATPTK